MEPLGDDELLHIYNKIPYDLEGKRSFAQVCKKFLKIACIGLYRLDSSFPVLLFDVLPSSPNIERFTCYTPLSNAHIKLLAHCPKLQELILQKHLDPSSEFYFDFDFDDDGLCALGNACSRLRCVSLNRRLNVGDAGIASIVTSSKNLTHLNLKGCIRVTDESLKAIGRSGIHNLNLTGCSSITDLGLKYLADGDLKNSLQSLNLTKCDRISDLGVIHLNQMVSLTVLKLSKCGGHVTDTGIVAMSSQLQNIEILDLSWLINVTDISLLAISSNCTKLKDISLTGCKAITAEGLRAFTGHPTLERLVLFSCYNFSWEDVKLIALTCIKLEYLGIMKRIKTPMPESSQECIQIGDRFFGINWDEDNGPIFCIEFVLKSEMKIENGSDFWLGFSLVKENLNNCAQYNQLRSSGEIIITSSL
ncbi:hypothetical protein L1987_79502 [Smallanthus sonchifolius]|uniref:Uncharacterized protein n=1 Tax=Smallanthus sonchifolius TaxID=185202 RepID=A0ACB8ZFL0_9ASTR|nr:hypothetical protein L1987_79502 [Smallanthus sonchifolius]